MGLDGGSSFFVGGVCIFGKCLLLVVSGPERSVEF